jgi:pimeloyl-ACP methyl ester carboxylesterase
MERLAWAEHGDPDGFPVLFFHGTPGSRLGHDRLGAAALVRGLRLVCPDRAGIGRAAPARGRRALADAADDVAALADHLGLDRFAVVGYSGGGAYALAAAARLGQRVSAVGLLAAAGPCDRDGALDGPSFEDRVVCWLSTRAPRLAGSVLRAAWLSTRLAPRAALRSLRRSLGPADRAVIDRDGRAVLTSFLEAFRQGPGGVVDDYRLSSEPWGFALERRPRRSHRSCHRSRGAAARRDARGATGGRAPVDPRLVRRPPGFAVRSARHQLGQPLRRLDALFDHRVDDVAHRAHLGGLTDHLAGRVEVHLLGLLGVAVPA